MDAYHDVEVVFSLRGWTQHPVPSTFVPSTGLLTEKVQHRNDIGQRIATARLQQRMTQRQLAQRVHLKVKMIQQFELNALQPTREQLAALRKVLRFKTD